jgi:hypothetical protein
MSPVRPLKNTEFNLNYMASMKYVHFVIMPGMVGGLTG